MKRVEMKKGRVIETPWLRVDEAAAYCGLSRTAFVERSAPIPYEGDESIRIYHVNVLDAFIRGDLPDAPFSKKVPVSDCVPNRRRTRPRAGAAGLGLIADPITGKIPGARRAT